MANDDPEPLPPLPPAMWDATDPYADSNIQTLQLAAALAVQDAVSHLRSMEALATAVTGASLNGVVRTPDGPEADRYYSAMKAASGAVTEACRSFEHVARVAERLLRQQLDDESIVEEHETETVTAPDGTTVTKRTTRRVRRRSEER